MSGSQRGSSTVLLIVGMVVVIIMAYFIIHLYKTDQLGVRTTPLPTDVRPTMSSSTTTTK